MKKAKKDFFFDSEKKLTADEKILKTEPEKEKIELTGDTEKTEQVEQETNLTDVLNSLTETETESLQSEKPKKGRKSKYTKQKELEAERKILTLSTSFALISLTQLIAKVVGNEKWAITEQTEADTLSSAIITYLEIKFPNWTEIAPEFNLILTLSSYFAKRI